jgi:glucokinase
MKNRKHAIGIDLGGTWMRAAIFSREGALISKRKEKVETRNKESITQQIVALTVTLCQQNKVEIENLVGIGIASTGPLDIEKGELVKPVNLPFDSVPLKEPIEEQLHIPTFLVNDCTGAVLGEKKFGAGKGIDNLVYVTIGTGIGGGAIVDANLLLGKDGNAVEIGHLTIDYEGRLKCGCGKRGHWEAYCSGKNIPNFVRMRSKEVGQKTLGKSMLHSKQGNGLPNLSSEVLFDAAKRGDEFSFQLVNEIGLLNSIGFANVINAYDPSLITVGGTVTLMNERFILYPVKKHVKEYTVNRIPEIVVTPLGQDVGVYGAAAAAIEFTSP